MGPAEARYRAVRAIADTSRYDAPTEDRECDARCALDALEAEGLFVVDVRAELMPAKSLAMLESLASAYRGDWSDFDGRTLESQIGELRVLIEAEIRGKDVTGPLAAFAESSTLCTSCGSWLEYCDCPGS